MGTTAVTGAPKPAAPPHPPLRSAPARPAGAVYAERVPPVIPRDEIVFGDMLGSGASGFARAATWNDRPVCVKVRPRSVFTGNALAFHYYLWIADLM